MATNTLPLHQSWTVAGVQYTEPHGPVTLTLSGSRGGIATHSVRPGITLERVASTDPVVLQHFTVEVDYTSADSPSIVIDQDDPNNVSIVIHHHPV